MKQIILGTAGHIDHGKTSLIKALTGIDTDRLKEEKARGITIELGFAHLKLPGGKRLGIVDVPGHEKFVKNMVAGATGIDLVALVIAADEGVMPQTREHLEICQLLKVKHGLVVLTKIDMVETDWLELVREDVSEYLSESFLADAPIVEVSSTTGEGLEELIQTLDQLVEQIPERDTGHLFRLPIDRVFTMKGFGTVITGTSVSGKISTGDEVTLYPQGISSKVRGLHIHNKEVTEAGAGLRTAINLQGIEKMMLNRGNIVATKDSLRPTYMVDVVLDLLPSAPRKLKNRAKVRFHAGTAEIISTLILLDRDELKPGDTCFAQIRLDAPTAVLKGDRYVLRSYSPVQTIGGGEILNPLPNKKKRFSKGVLSELKTLHTGGVKESVELFVALGRFQGVEESGLSFLANLSGKKLAEPLKALKAQKRIIQFDKERDLLIHADFLQKARDEVMETIDAYHKSFPLKTGLLKEELRSRTTGAKNPKLFNYLIRQLSQEGEIVQEKEVVRLKTHKVTLAQDQKKTRQKLEAIYAKSGLQPPYFKELKEEFPGNTAKEVLDVMVKEGRLLKVKEDLYFDRNAVDALEEKLIAFLKNHGEITTPQFKEMTGTSRKYTIPLIEYFDLSQITVRVGDSRVLRKK
ncbi:MAG: selenocysteine-specific translation elongation factor [Deltaproteobacteria bacterium]|nr:selenocysteine-specific translation elongation factor [Deltaproteobacteria bacterium]